MITRRGLLTLSAAGAAFSAAGLVPQGIAQSLAKTVHILSGFTPGTQDAIARIIAGQMHGAVLTQPNLVGRTMVWKHYIDGHPRVRCFIPGSMS